MLVRQPLDIPFVLEGVETVDGGLIGDDLAGELDFSDQRRTAVLSKIVLDKPEHRMLFLSQEKLGQPGLQR